MLFDGSEETTRRSGLGVIPGTIRWLPPGVQAAADAVEPARRSTRPTTRCSPGSARDAVGVLRALAARRARRSGGRSPRRATYGGVVNAAFRHGNVFATQFHPEKSGAAGLALLGNFVRIASLKPMVDGPTLIELYPAIDLRDGRSCA